MDEKQNIEISTWSDGYVLTHNNKDYKYKGKSDDTIKMISDKVQELLLKDRNKLIKEASDKIINGGW